MSSTKHTSMIYAEDERASASRIIAAAMMRNEELEVLDLEAARRLREATDRLKEAEDRLKEAENKTAKKRRARRVRAALDARDKAWDRQLEVWIQSGDIQELVYAVQDLAEQELEELVPPDHPSPLQLLDGELEELAGRVTWVDPDALLELARSLFAFETYRETVTGLEANKAMPMGPFEIYREADPRLPEAKLDLEKAASALDRAWAHWDRAMAEAEAEADADEAHLEALEAKAKRSRRR